MWYVRGRTSTANCAETVSNPLVFALLGLHLSERQIPRVGGFTENGLKHRELLKRAVVRPRQVRYQAALRPTLIGLHFKLLRRTARRRAAPPIVIATGPKRCHNPRRSRLAFWSLPNSPIVHEANLPLNHFLAVLGVPHRRSLEIKVLGIDGRFVQRLVKLGA
jgi:hypothetical protein